MTIDLPADLKLPLQSGAPYWYWLGNRLAVDFVNTMRERWWRRVECLCSPEDLATWLDRAGVCPTGVTTGPQMLRAARRLREAIDLAICAQIEERSVPESVVNEIDRWLRYAPVPMGLGTDGRQLKLQPQEPQANRVRHALALVALDAARMLGTEERTRVRICASDNCSARFFDRSRAGNGRWCTMSGCGNREKARRHRSLTNTSERST